MIIALEIDWDPSRSHTLVREPERQYAAHAIYFCSEAREVKWQVASLAARI